MALKVKRWYRSKRQQILILAIFVICIGYYAGLMESLFTKKLNMDRTRRYIEQTLQEALKEDKGSGCEIPHLDPFAKEVTQFDKNLPKVVCTGQDWVKCYHSECRVVPEVLVTMKGITCMYNDIIYKSDKEYTIGVTNVVLDDDVYVLKESDHVKVTCTGYREKRTTPVKWFGFAIGFRKSVERKPLHPGRDDSFNVLIFGFDSTSKNVFIRRMPKSFKYLTDLKFTILNGYNIVGDGTPAALFPILTGKTELELPEARKGMSKETMDVMPFIFYKLKDDGYRTAYFEDTPSVGTFQYRFNGFRHQPADHYLRAFYLEHEHRRNRGRLWYEKSYCVGDTPQYKLMMNITDQFLRLDGKKFIFTFIADITHDDVNMIATADDDMVQFLEGLMMNRLMDNTLIIVMGDHGPRYAHVRDTFQGKLEERLPLMAIHLPEELKRHRPEAQLALEANVQALSTPHDIHATILDVLDMRQHYNPYKVAGADLPRGMTLLEPIPRNRTCSEAGIEPHWCTCLKWCNVSEDDPLYNQAADTFISYINSLTESVRSECVPRTINRVVWMMKQFANQRMLMYAGVIDADGYVGKFNNKFNRARENYELKVEVGPGRGVYEASLQYQLYEKIFTVNTRDISRTNAYGNEPSCISAKLPHLNPYCYCKNYVH